MYVSNSALLYLVIFVHFISKINSTVGVLVCSGCYKKIPKNGWLKQKNFFFLSALEAGNPRSRSCRDLFLVRLYSWFLDSTFSIYAHMVDRKVSGLLIKAVIPSLRPHPHDQRRQWHPTPVRLPGKSHGWRSLVGCSPWSR